jgi:hypothetical protein
VERRNGILSNSKVYYQKAKSSKCSSFENEVNHQAPMLSQRL